jgi:hypothetical protein
MRVLRQLCCRRLPRVPCSLQRQKRPGEVTLLRSRSGYIPQRVPADLSVLSLGIRQPEAFTKRIEADLLEIPNATCDSFNLGVGSAF